MSVCVSCQPHFKDLEQKLYDLEDCLFKKEQEIRKLNQEIKQLQELNSLNSKVRIPHEELEQHIEQLLASLRVQSLVGQGYEGAGH